MGAERAISARFSRLAMLGRWLVGLIGAVSLVVFVLLLYFWVRSHFIAEVIYFRPVAAPEEFASPMPNKAGRWEYQWNLASCAGRFQVVRRNLGIGEGSAVKTWHLRPGDPSALAHLTPRDPLDVHWHLGGVEYFRCDRRYLSTPPMRAWVWGFVIVTVPYWLLAAVTAILPGILAVRYVRGRRRRRRMAAGMCAKCGYDLRASSGVCPECGGKIETSSAVLRR